MDLTEEANCGKKKKTESIPFFMSDCPILAPIQYEESKSKVKLATVVEGDSKASFSIATTPWCRIGRYSIPGIATLYP